MTSRRILIAAAAAAGLVGAVLLGLPYVDARLDAEARAAVVTEAAERGRQMAVRDLREGRVVLRRTCFFPAASYVWCENYGVECPLNIFRSCDYGEPSSSEAQNRLASAYDAVMMRHVLARYGPGILAAVAEQARPLQEQWNKMGYAPNPALQRTRYARR